MGLLEAALVTPRDLSSLNTLKRHGLSLAEIKISQVSAAKGQLLENIGLPENTRALAILRNQQIVLTLTSVFIEEGDTVFLLTDDETAVRSAFTI